MFKLKFRPDTDRDAIVREMLLHPLGYLRILSIICSSVVFGCVVDRLNSVYRLDNSVYRYQCAFNNNVNCCKLAIAVGWIGFVISLMFLVKDVLYHAVDFSENFNFKVLMVLVDAAVHIPTGLLWFASFSFSADQWRKTNKNDLQVISLVNHGNAVVAFSFFCVLLWLANVIINMILMICLMLKRGGRSRGYASFPEGSDSVHPDGPSTS